MTRTVFRNAPLVEMIAEIRWSLTPVKSIPGGGLDPFYDLLRTELQQAFAKLGYSDFRETVPAEIPREFLAGQVTTQFRRDANSWPLFQFGPGILTINITDQYEGWESFRPVVLDGVAALLHAHPALPTLKLNSLKLLAIDAFSSRHGYTSYTDFANVYLNLGNLLPASFLAEFTADPEDINVRSETRYPLKAPHSSLGRVSISDGTRDSEKALIIQSSVETSTVPQVNMTSLETPIMGWFDEAHHVHSRMFKDLLGPDLREILGETEIK